jgi:hypothetical protein
MSCSAPTIVVGGVTLSTNDFENAAELVNTVSGDSGDPTLDEYNENIANGNNTSSTTGVQIPPEGNPPTQTTLPTPSPVTPDTSDTKPAAGGNGSSILPAAWDGNYDTLLSPNFKVRDFTINAVFPNQLIAYGSYSADTRFNNLRALAKNVAEPLFAKFGRFNVTSGLRNKTSTSSGVSQHITGQAIDVQFTGWTYARYWENAAWIRDNIPFDQFIFEHSDKTGLAWYHLSFNPSGNRAVTERTKIMTMYRNHYDPGLHNHA